MIVIGGHLWYRFFKTFLILIFSLIKKILVYFDGSLTLVKIKQP